MKVILLEDVKNLGKKNTVVDTKDGYAINYLIPHHLAEYCTAKNENELNARLQKIAEEEAKRREEATALKNKLDNLTITLSLKTNHGQAFGSISQKQIVDVYDKLFFRAQELQHFLKILKNYLMFHLQSVYL